MKELDDLKKRVDEMKADNKEQLEDLTNRNNELKQELVKRVDELAQEKKELTEKLEKAKEKVEAHDRKLFRLAVFGGAVALAITVAGAILGLELSHSLHDKVAEEVKNKVGTNVIAEIQGNRLIAATNADFIAKAARQAETNRLPEQVAQLKKWQKERAVEWFSLEIPTKDLPNISLPNAVNPLPDAPALVAPMRKWVEKQKIFTNRTIVAIIPNVDIKEAKKIGRALVVTNARPDE
jgi:hypothetical protein